MTEELFDIVVDIVFTIEVDGVAVVDMEENVNKSDALSFLSCSASR